MSEQNPEIRIAVNESKTEELARRQDGTDKTLASVAASLERLTRIEAQNVNIAAGVQTLREEVRDSRAEQHEINTKLSADITDIQVKNAGHRDTLSYLKLAIGALVTGGVAEALYFIGFHHAG